MVIPYSTMLLAGSLVLHVMIALLDDIEETETLEITGGVMSAPPVVVALTS